MIPLLLAKLDTECAQFVAELVNQGNQKSKLVSLALAKALSTALPVPTECSDHPDVDFSRQFKPMLTQKIVLINELLLVDIDETIELAKQFYVYRHNCVFCCDPIPYLHQDTAVLDFFGISKVFSPDTLTVIAEHNSKLTCYVSKFCNILDKLKD